MATPFWLSWPAGIDALGVDSPPFRRDNQNMTTFVWPAEDGWPYPDDLAEVTDHSADVDDDLVSLHAGSPHLLDDLDDAERRVVTAHYGLDGSPPRSMKQLRNETGLSRAEVRQALGTGLEKLRSRLNG